MNKKECKNNEEENYMTVLVNEINKMSEITTLSNEIQLIKLNILEGIKKISNGLKVYSDPNIKMESLLIDYYSHGVGNYEDMAEESILLANEAEEAMRKYID